MKVATAVDQASRATLGLVHEVVAKAMAKAGLEIAHTVILYLSDDYAHDPEPAIRAAARAANCLQVVGCTCNGLFTEDDWVLDAPAAAAMVFGEAVLDGQRTGPEDWLFTLAAPNAIDTSWLNQSGRRFGGVAGDATGQGPYKVWSHGRVSELGRCELPVTGGGWRVGLSQGVLALSPVAPVTAVRDHDILAVDEQPALFNLARHLPDDMGKLRDYPVHLLMVGLPFGDPERAVEEGRYLTMPVLSANSQDRSVTVSTRLEVETPMFWAQRQPQEAERDMAQTLGHLSRESGSRPEFGLMFPCMGRGPYFFGGVDRDLDQFVERFPGVPLIGFHGNGEFAHLNGANRLLQYSTVVALRYPDV
jgi:small ligand-binding sensory domain FIST